MFNVSEQRHKQKHDNFCSTLNNSQEIHRKNQEKKGQQGVKFNENDKKRTKNFVLCQPRHEASSLQEGRSFHPNFSRYEYPSRECNYSSSDSDTTEIEDGAESLYDNQNFEMELSESVFEGDDDIQHSIQDLQKGLNRLTSRYVRKVKSKVNGTMSRMKLENRKTQLPKQQERNPGVGDIKAKVSQADDELYKKMDLMKKDCYKKIEANLNMLKNIDNLTDEINHNLFNQRKTSK